MLRVRPAIAEAFSTYPPLLPNCLSESRTPLRSTKAPIQSLNLKLLRRPGPEAKLELVLPALVTKDAPIAI